MSETFDAWLIRALRTAGAYNGVYDGAHGREVIEALKRFQYQQQLETTGTANAATIDALRRVVNTFVLLPIEPVWLRESRRLMGLKEVVGPGSNPQIMEWARTLGGWVASNFKDDDTPWCGLFMAHVIGATLPKEPLPANPLSALAWAKFGTALDVPSLGAVMVFERPGGHHVCLYTGEDNQAYWGVGGNQQNRVSETRIPRSRKLVAVRWPKTAPPPVARRLFRTPSGGLSRNEA